MGLRRRDSQRNAMVVVRSLQWTTPSPAKTVASLSNDTTTCAESGSHYALAPLSKELSWRSLLFIVPCKCPLRRKASRFHHQRTDATLLYTASGARVPQLSSMSESRTRTQPPT